MGHLVQLSWGGHGHVVGHALCCGGGIADWAEDVLAEAWGCPGIVGPCGCVAGLVWAGGWKGGGRVVEDGDFVGADHLGAYGCAEHGLGVGVCVVRGSGVVWAVWAAAVEA